MVKVARALMVFVIEVQWVGDGCVEERMFSSQFVQLAVRSSFPWYRVTLDQCSLLGGGIRGWCISILLIDAGAGWLLYDLLLNPE